MGNEVKALLAESSTTVPRTLQYRVVELAHEGHLGTCKTKALLRTKGWFPGVDTAAEEAVNGFIPYQAVTADKLEVTVDKLEGNADKLEVTADKLQGNADKLEVTADNLDGNADKLEGTSDKLDGAPNPNCPIPSE